MQGPRGAGKGAEEGGGGGGSMQEDGGQAAGASPVSASVVHQEAWGRFQNERKQRLGERAEAERCATERARARDAEDSRKAETKKREAAELQAFLRQQIEDKKRASGGSPQRGGETGAGLMGAQTNSAQTSPGKFAQRQAPGTQQEIQGLVAQQAMERHRAEVAAMEADKAKNEEFLSQRLKELNQKEDMLREKKKKDAEEMQACLLRQMEEKRGTHHTMEIPAQTPGKSQDHEWKFPMMPSEADAMANSSAKNDKMANYRAELLNQINTNKLMEQEEKELLRQEGIAERQAMEENMIHTQKVSRQRHQQATRSQVFNYDD